MTALDLWSKLFGGIEKSRRSKGLGSAEISESVSCFFLSIPKHRISEQKNNI